MSTNFWPIFLQIMQISVWVSFVKILGTPLLRLRIRIGFYRGLLGACQNAHLWLGEISGRIVRFWPEIRIEYLDKPTGQVLHILSLLESVTNYHCWPFRPACKKKTLNALSAEIHSQVAVMIHEQQRHYFTLGAAFSLIFSNKLFLVRTYLSHYLSILGRSWHIVFWPLWTSS